jgi:hypothetical protein
MPAAACRRHLSGRYAASTRKERGRILDDEFTAVRGLHGKHAMRLLRTARSERRSAGTACP